MSRSFSHSSSTSPGSGRLQQQVSQRLRSSSFKKPPEPLRRAVADCLSTSSSSLHGVNPSTIANDAARTLRDYLAAYSTTDLAYNVIVEHALAERERSPAVVAKCVALLKRYLLRYVPSEQTLLQIDQFCVSSIFECDFGTTQRATPWSKSLSQQYGASVAFQTSSFSSGTLVKSLNYVRSLVARHIPKHSFQPSNFSGVSNSSKLLLPTLSSLLGKSFNSPLSPTSITSRGSPERKETSALSVSNSTTVERVERKEVNEYIHSDVLTWRWPEEQRLPLTNANIDGVMKLQDSNIHGFLEVGAAALLVGDTESKMKGQPWQQSGGGDIPDLDQLLQPSTVTTATNLASAHSHLKVITASKRTKPGPNQVWEDLSVSTFHPRSRPLFQYRPYSEQQPLRLNPAEVQEVIAAVCSETSLPKSNLITVSSRLSNNSGKPSMDAAVSVLIKLVIDMYVLDSRTAAPLTLSMLQEMLSSRRLMSKIRAFDLIINLGVHSHLLEPMLADDPTTIEEELSQEMYLNNEAQLQPPLKKVDTIKKQRIALAIINFEDWLLSILYEILLLLVQVIKKLLVISRENLWAELVHSKLICMLANMFYQVESDSNGTIFLEGQVDLLGGIEFVCLEYSQAKSREEKRNLFAVILDYALHQINETCVNAGDSEYSFDEFHPVATILTLYEAPEAFCISAKHGVQGVGGILGESISAALSQHPNSDQLNTIWEKISKKLETIISSFSHLNKEFSHMIHTTKSYHSLQLIEGGTLDNSIQSEAKIAWATLHSLLHSERIAYRQNGYIWLVELLLTEISEEKEKSIWSSFKNLQRQIGLAGSQEYSNDSQVPLAIWILCGLLKSKHNFIRWGFLFVIDKLLMRCKLLLDENELQASISDGESRLEKANAVIDIMSSALSLVAQINETDRINILKMCDMLFSQLCLRLISSGVPPPTDMLSVGVGTAETVDNERREMFIDSEIDSSSVCKTASLAALLLQGQAIVPMQLVAHVPTALLYWPLIQLAGAAADDIALGVAVGSKGRGNLPGATSDIRAALLLLLIGKCTADSAAFQEVGGDDFFRELLDDTDSRVAYYCSAFLLKRMMTEEPEKYQRMLQSLIFRAQQSNNEKLLENPYLQIRGILQLSNDLGAGL
ncbi:hypothetical protein ACHQM5_009777 [Ranunculus cassubicifolius]